jgi:hypothetical protein
VTRIKVGLDFDNTIVCYENAVEVLADQRLKLPAKVPRTKVGVRNYLRREEREEEWTHFQGELYGPGMRYAKPFEGAIEAMLQLVDAGHELIIVSHRSRHPYAGEPHDLHAAAGLWVSERLQSKGLFAENNGDVYFLETQKLKLAKISELRCNAFVDDLPDVLGSPDFPTNTKGILFDPLESLPETGGHLRMTTWSELKTLLQVGCDWTEG